MLSVNTVSSFAEEQQLFPAVFQQMADRRLDYLCDGETVSFTLTEEVSCTCKEEGCCVHIASAWKKAKADGKYDLFCAHGAQLLADEMSREMTRTLPGGEGLRMVIGLRLYPDGRTGLGLSIGQERMYAVRNIEDLLTSYSLGVSLPISDKFTYQPSTMRFSREDERLLSMLGNHIPLKAGTAAEWEEALKLGEAPGEYIRPNGISLDGRFLIMNHALQHSLLRYLEGHEFVLVNGSEKTKHNAIRTLEVPLCFFLSMTPTELVVQAKGFDTLRMISPDGRYLMWDGRPVHVHGPQARICKLLCQYGHVFRYPAAEAEAQLSLLLPSLSTLGTVIPSAELNGKLINEKLVSAVYIDLEGSNVVARVEFHYGDRVINPFEAAAEEEETGRMLLRDGRAESELLGMLADAGFVVRSGKIILRRPKDILQFCTQGISELSKKSEVYASTAFEKVKPRRLTAKINFRMHNGRLVMSLLEESGEPLEALTVLHAIEQRQEYVRLKNGEFLDIRDMSGLAPVVQEVLEAAQLDDPAAEEDAREIRFRSYRSAYLVSMLEASGVNTEADASVPSGTDLTAEKPAESYLPEKLNAQLTEYQKRGANWLFSLYDSSLGGVLADEMGLGKTVQIIALLSAAKKRDGVQKSIIVTPTSLSYHWLAELRRFNDKLVVRMVSGHREERHAAIAEMKKDDTVDVILTSYPLLRRDIELLKDVPFRFAILDEAQSVKNAQSLGSVCAKELDARVKIALTGTPMENHTGELWSIFDFVLPGYLGSQSSFLRRYGGGENAEELRGRIRPFLMRRLKADVLQDLPEKHETCLYCAMMPEQEKVYQQLLSSLREHVGQALEDGSLPRARMQVLSLLLKLRQVCCHPKLFLQDYEGSSGKLELLVSTVQNALANKHRLLIFSQFVGMLQIIRKRLAREGISSLYLDGDTKPETRQDLCDRFNGGEGRVFLISLKAGGTGLNLIGADLVIHFDPWWNPAAEDQATDRAHRIGQSRDVEVIRMITQGSIEEKVTDLGRRKRAIFDKVVMAGETGLSDLTEEEIRALFFT